MAGITEISLLSQMLDESSKLEKERDEQHQVARLGPGDIGPPKAAASQKPEKKKDPNAIWDEDEVNEARLFKNVSKTDNRAKPKYDVRYRQKIKCDDALGAPWSVQDSSSMSCNELLIKVEMPGTKYSTVKLDVTSREFLVQAPKYMLALPLQMLDESSELEKERDEPRQVARLGPGDIGPPKAAASQKPEEQEDPNAIWDEEEVDEESCRLCCHANQ